MNNQEYKKILKEWNDFLLKEENCLLNEQLLLEKFILSEGLRDIASKYGKKGLLYLVSLVLSSSLTSKDASGEPLLNDNQRNVIEDSLEEPPEDSKELEDLAKQPEIVAQIKTKFKLNNQSSFKGFLKSEDLERFYRQTGKKVFTKESMSITKLPGIYVKETFELDKASSKELNKIIEKAKKIYDEQLDERTFLITVNGKKYGVVVEPDLENSRNQIMSLLIRWSHNIANTITDLVVSKINSNDKKLIEKAESCQFDLALKISNMTLKHSLRGKNSAGSYIDVENYFSYWAKCFDVEIDETSTFSFNNTGLVGIITLPSGFFESWLSSKVGLEGILIHELGHLLSSQSGTAIVDNYMLRKFYKFLEEDNKTKSFNLKDIAKFILREELSAHMLSMKGILPMLSKKTKKLILKASKTFASQLLGSSAIEKIDDTNFSFIIGIEQSYYNNLEERIENTFTVVNSIYSNSGYEYKQNAIKFLRLLKKKNPSMKKEDLQELFNKKYLGHVFSKRKSFFKLLVNGILDSSFFNLDFDNLDSSNIDKEKAFRMLSSLINDLIDDIEKEKDYFEVFDGHRFFQLINLEGFNKNPTEGARLLKNSLESILKIVEENNNSHEGHDH